MASTLAASNTLWLPRGRHWDMHIEHDSRAGNGAGAFTGGGWKLDWHITVSRWGSIDAMVDVLHDKSAEPHFVIGGRAGTKLPVVVQLLPLNVAGRSLQHPAGTPETNRANAIQVEICAEPGDVFRAGLPDARGLFRLPQVDVARIRDFDEGDLCMLESPETARSFRSGVDAWTDDTYKALANLAELVRHRVDIPTRLARSFQNTKRFTPAGFVRVKGHLGHMHTPNNVHVDPTTGFKGDRLMKFMASAPNRL